MAIQLIVGQGVMHNRIFLRKCARWSAMAARETGAPRAASRRDRSAPRPWPVSAVATFWPSHGHGWAGAVTEAGGGWHGADKSCDRRDTTPVAGASPLRVCTAC